MLVGNTAKRQYLHRLQLSHRPLGSNVELPNGFYFVIKKFYTIRVRAVEWENIYYAASNTEIPSHFYLIIALIAQLDQLLQQLLPL